MNCAKIIIKVHAIILKNEYVKISQMDVAYLSKIKFVVQYALGG